MGFVQRWGKTKESVWQWVLYIYETEPPPTTGLKPGDAEPGSKRFAAFPARLQ
jgi:hypothetical protein